MSASANAGVVGGLNPRVAIGHRLAVLQKDQHVDGEGVGSPGNGAQIRLGIPFPIAIPIAIPVVGSDLPDLVMTNRLTD